MIVAEGITKSFGNLQVLKGINLTINQGEVVSIVGPSGAGKQRYFRYWVRWISRMAGVLLIHDTDVLHLSEQKLSAFRNQNIGFVFQFHQLLPEFTALENVMIPALIANEKASAA